MESSSGSPTREPRTCPSCLKAEPEIRFYKNAVEGENCRSCVLSAGRTRDGMLEAVSKHKQEKLIREELKRIASRRAAVKRHKKAKAAREARVKEILPKPILEAERVEVDAATQELAKRVLERRRLIEFVMAFHPRYKAGWVHYDICQRLEKFAEDCAKGLSPRLMILMPPRHGKSQIASKLFPAWVLGHYPWFEVMATSYNVSLALEFSREVRGVIKSSRYAQLFPGTKLSSEAGAAEAWKLSSETGVGAGGYIAAGIGGPINGKGAHILIIDDPIKNAEEADSADQRNKIWEWYNSTAYTRLAPGAGVLVIQTWWHDDDLAGRMIQQMKEDPEADQYVIIKYPAEAIEDEEFRMKGEPLHPARYDTKALNKIKRQLGGEAGRWWSALYQQNPVPAEGAMFKKDYLRWRTDEPNLDVCYLYSSWDFALGEKRVNDWTVGILAAVDWDGVIHILDMVRFRSGDQIRIADTILNHYQDHPNVKVIGVEEGHIWKGIEPHLQRRMRERNLYPTLDTNTPLTDKTIRAQPLQGMMQSHMVTLPRNASWVGIMVQELLRFPGGMHDDVVDALAWLVRTVLKHAAPPKPKPPRNMAEKTVEEKLRAMARGGLNGGGAMAA